MAAGPASGIWAVWRLLEPTVLRDLRLRAAATSRALPTARAARASSINAVRISPRAPRRRRGLRRRSWPRRTYTTALLRMTFSWASPLRRLRGAGAGLHLRPHCACPAPLSCAQRRRALDHLLIWRAAGVAIPTTTGIFLGAVRVLRFFRTVPIAEFLFGLSWSPQTAIRADRWAVGRVRRGAVVRGQLLIADCDAGRSADRPVLRDLPVGVRSRRPRLGQADPRDPRRHPDRGLRLLRGADGGPGDPRRPANRRARRLVRERARRRAGHGHHDHPIRVLALRRRDLRRCRRRCATARYGLGATRAETIRRSLSRPRFRASSGGSCSRSAVPSARP